MYCLIIITTSVNSVYHFSTLLGDTSEVLVLMDKPRVGKEGSGPGAYIIMCDYI